MLKKMLLCCTLLFIGCQLQAQQDSIKAKKLLDQVSKKVKSYDNMVIKFNYILEDDGENVSRQTKGNVALKGNKYKLELMGTTRIFDGKKLYNIIPEDEEINISNYDPESEDELSPSRMFTFYEKGYEYRWDITQTRDGRKIQYVKLLPKKPDDQIKEILLGIDAHTKHIAKVIQIMDDKSKVVINVSSFKTNQPLSENMFKFSKDRYQGYYINRLD